MTKKTKKSLPFATTPPKGKIRRHFVIGVSSGGSVEVYEPGTGESMESAQNGAMPYDGSEHTVEFHHVIIDLAIPKKIPVSCDDQGDLDQGP